MQRLKVALAVLLSLHVLLLHGQGRDTFEIYFPVNDARLGKQATDYIDRLVFKDTLIHGNKLLILGYTDYVGSNGHNDSLSRRRAKAVKDYLATMGFDKDDISLCIGKGKIGRQGASGNEGYAADRKVQIVIERTVATPPVSPPKPKPKPAAVDISKMGANQTFAMEDICFVPGSYELLPQSAPALQALLGYMKQYPNMKIRIEGHICCLPSNEADDIPYGTTTLSAARAGTVRHYLINRGINESRIEAIGLGTRNPVVKNEVTEEDRIKNRRVEIRILSK